MSNEEYGTLYLVARNELQRLRLDSGNAERIARDSVTSYFLHYVANGVAVDNPLALVRQIARNALFGETARNGKRRIAETEYAEANSSADRVDDPAERLHGRERSVKLQQLVDEFSEHSNTQPKTVDVIRLWLSGVGTKDIKLALGIDDAKTVRGAIASFVRFLKRRRSLRKLLQDLR